MTTTRAYASSAPYYDLLYSSKDYEAEAELLAARIRATHPHAVNVLDVACGTGNHAAALAARGFEVDGIDLEPAFVEAARARCPGGTFTVADMRSFDLGRRYDVVLSLFSSIGYALTVPMLERTIERLAAHLAPTGLLVVDPWFEPGDLTHHWVGMLVGEAEGLKVCRAQRTVIDGTISTLEFTYLVATPGGVDQFTESHALGLFTPAEMEAAFRRAGLAVERIPEALRRGRKLYLGTRA